MMRRIRPNELQDARRPVLDNSVHERAGAIIAAVQTGGTQALREIAQSLGDVAPDAPLVITREQCAAQLNAFAPSARALLERTAARIEQFASRQLECLSELDVSIEGGRAGHSVSPVDVAGCYAPGGRYPLPSSVLMTAITARVAGVERVVVASPRPDPVTLAAAAVAGADQVLAVGGAQAIAALAFGIEVPAADVIVGPGNQWVTAAKQLLAGKVEIDMLAGPSELAILADDQADATLIAADLCAQAEHDDQAIPILITPSSSLVERVDTELANWLERLPTRETATRAFANGFACVTADLDEAVEVSDRIAPEHLQVMTENATQVAQQLRHYGAIFIGPMSAEVLGDYGAGPNHVLPTAGAARVIGGLSVLRFLRVRTWLTIDAAGSADLLRDARDFARLEGLEGHARAAEVRLGFVSEGRGVQDPTTA